MFNSKFNTLLTGLLVVAIIAIIGLMIYFGYSIYSKYSIETGAKDAVDAFDNATGSTPPQSQPKPDENVDGNLVIGGVQDSGNSIYSTPSSTPTTYKGYNVVGTISIPKIDIESKEIAAGTS